MSVGVIIVGAAGRMGQALQRLMADYPDLHHFANIELESSLPNSAAGAIVVVDFSSPAGFRRALSWCVEHKCPLVSGTTGLGEDDERALRQAAGSIPVLWSANMSRGINVMFQGVQAVASRLGTDADAEVLETHHRNKLDAPSGTALALGQCIANARGQSDDVLSGNASRSGARKAGEIGFAVRRGGDIAGEHSATFYLDGECVEITHRATSRDIFARGALQVVAWIADQHPGCYQMADVHFPNPE